MSKAEPSGGNASQVQIEPAENQIVVYQPNETVWLNQARLAELFCVDRTVVNRHIHNIYKTGELDESATCAKIAQVQVEGGRSIMRTIPFYNLDMIIVRLTIFTSEHYDKKHIPHRKISPADVATFNAQYPKLAVRYNETFHDRFLIIDDKELYLMGASLKDLGSKCFAFTNLDPADIRRIKKSAFHPAP